MNKFYLFLTLLAPVIWGTTYFVTTEYMPPDKPFLLGAIRALPAALILLLFIRKWPERKWLMKLAWLSVFNIFLFFILFFYAAYNLPGGAAATIGALNPFFVAIFAWPLLNQKPAKHTIFSSILGVIGVALLVLTANEKLNGIGIAAALGATLSIAPGTVLLKKWEMPYSPIEMTAWQLLFAGIAMLLVSFLTEIPFPKFSNKALVGGAYLSFIATGLAYFLWLYGLEKIKPHMAAVLTLLTPIVAVSIDWALLGKTLQIKQLIGGFLIIAAILFETYKEAKNTSNVKHLNNKN